MKYIVFLFLFFIYSQVFAERCYEDCFSIETSMTDYIALSIVPDVYKGLLSFERIKSYDRNGIHIGYILLVFEHTHFRYDSDRTGISDISDLIDAINFHFPKDTV